MGWHPQFRPLVICSEAGRPAAMRADVASITWKEFLLGEPRAAT